ncbi:MAG: stalk domain-containing protein [Candidatus Cohnella colombiensis]|uniref:Stalk domain-containing protein n=1 Tax=Candidatus Cohnella colombiensis TaxID=3121368 RepID=A0AA95EUS8_9BACL|nr:MAG: stalk domain-containing protein [Cohnella sp.]
MSLINKRHHFFALFLAAILFIVTAIPTHAASASSSGDVVVRVKVGSTQMTINGEKLTIEAPFVSGGTTLVPISVFTNAKGFGAKVKLTGKSIQLTYQGHTIVVTKDDKAATMDGKKVTLVAAPVVKKGVTMVPVTAIAKAFGIKYSTDSSTKELVLSGAAAGSTTTSTNINTDAGKTQIGDSYFQWTINYPTGLIQEYQSSNGDVLVFRDIKKQFFLQIAVEDATELMTTEDIRAHLLRYVSKGETLVDKRTVTTATGTTYEKIVTKDKNGFFFEFRGTQTNKFLYTTIYGKTAANLAEFNAVGSILDSFKTSFNRSNKSIKDLTKIIDGFKVFLNSDFALAVSLPKDWKEDEESSYPYYEYEDAYMFMDVTSLEAGDTASAWAKRMTDRFEQLFAAEYGKIVEQKDITWNGVPAKVVKLRYSYDLTNWWEEYEVFAIKGNYRYYTEFAYPEKMASKKGVSFDQLINTMSVDFKFIESNFGLITDEYESKDRLTKVVQTNNDRGYQITVPKYWGKDEAKDEEGLEYYYFPGGLIFIGAMSDQGNPQAIISNISSNLQLRTNGSSLVKILSNSTVDFAGATATKIVVEDKSNVKVSPQVETWYLFSRNGHVYVVGGIYSLANGTPYVISQMEDALKSFTLTR